MHACLQMKKYADVISEGLNYKKQGLRFTLKWFPIYFPFLFFCQVGTGNKKKIKKKEGKLDAEGRIIKRGPHCIFHDVERQVPCFFFADKIGQLNIHSQLRKVKNAGLECYRTKTHGMPGI